MTEHDYEVARRQKAYGDLYDAILVVFVFFLMGLFTILNIPPWIWSIAVACCVGLHFMRKRLWGF